jgi:hypothetical protein
MNKYEMIKQVLQSNNGFIKISEIELLEISKTYFYEFVENEKLLRVSQGFYMTQDAWADDMYVLQTRYPDLIFSHESAAYLLSLSDREPLEYSITLKTGTSSSRLINEDVRVYKIKSSLFELGLVSSKTMTGNIVRSYNAERTLCDLVRNRRNTESQDLQSVIKTYISRKDRNIPELMRYAKLLSVDKIIKQYMEILL